MTPRLGGPACVVLVLLLGGCSASGGSHASPAPVVSGQAPATGDASVLAYGRAPTEGQGVTYQPDVVVVGGGAASVRSVSDDSLTWTIDAKAPHAAELLPGKIMFLTGRAVGRVLTVTPAGDAIAVLLGPFDLTDVIRDGHISITQSLDLSTATAQAFAKSPGTLDFTAHDGTASASPTTGPSGPSATTPTALGDGERIIRMPTVRLVAAGRAPNDVADTLPPPTHDDTTEATVGPFALELSKSVGPSGGDLNTKITYTKDGVTIGAVLTTKYSAPQAYVDFTMAGGKMVSAHARLDGLKQIVAKVEAGTTQGLAGNFKARIEFPIELNVQLPEAAIPVNLSFRFKAIVEPAFSAKDSTLTSTGQADVTGPLGFDYAAGSGFTALPTAVTVTKKAIDTLEGTSVGVNGFVFAAQMKVLIGLGVEAIEVGPFVSMTVSYGLTNGSDLGIVKCKQVSTDLVLGFGLGYTLAPPLAEFFKRLNLPNLTPKLDTEFAATTTTVLHTIDYAPKVKACTP